MLFRSDELAILKGENLKRPVSAAVTDEDLLMLQTQTEQIFVHDEIYDYIERLVQRTRNHEAIDLGVSPRGAICLVKMARALAFLRQREFVVPEDVTDLAVPVMAHRILESGRARMEQKTKEQLVEQIVKEERRPTLKRR